MKLPNSGVSLIMVEIIVDNREHTHDLHADTMLLQYNFYEKNKGWSRGYSSETVRLHYIILPM